MLEPGGEHRLSFFRAFGSRNYPAFSQPGGGWFFSSARGCSRRPWVARGSPARLFCWGWWRSPSQIPSFIAPIAGVVVDRWNRHHVLLATQALAMLQASLLAFLVLTGAVQVWHILHPAVFMGLIDAVDMPNRQSFVLR